MRFQSFYDLRMYQVVFKKIFVFIDYHAYVPNKMLKKLMMINSACVFYNFFFLSCKGVSICLYTKKYELIIFTVIDSKSNLF